MQEKRKSVRTYQISDRFAELQRLEHALAEMKRRKENDLTKALKAALAIAVPSYGLQKLLESYNRREFQRRELYNRRYRMLFRPAPIMTAFEPSRPFRTESFHRAEKRELFEERMKMEVEKRWKDAAQLKIKIERLRALSEAFARERSKERRAALKRQIEEEMKAFSIREEKSFHRRARSSSREREISLVR